MKIIYEIDDKEADFHFKKEAFDCATTYKLKIDTLYDGVFRPKIKYGQDSNVEIYEKIWQEIYEHFNN